MLKTIPYYFYQVDAIEGKGDDQSESSDGRSVDQVYQALLDRGLQPVMNDYVYV